MEAFYIYICIYFIKLITYTFERMSARTTHTGIKFKSIVLTIATETQFVVFLFVKSRNTFPDQH